MRLLPCPSKSLFAAVVMAMLAAGCNKKSQAPTSSTQPPSPVQKAASSTLWREFGQDPTGAAQRYRDKTLEIDGIVRNVVPRGDGLVIGISVLYAGDSHVLCEINPDKVSAFSTVKPRGTVTLRGTCLGSSKDPRVYDGYVVKFKDCEFVASSPPPGNDGQMPEAMEGLRKFPIKRTKKPAPAD